MADEFYALVQPYLLENSNDILFTRLRDYKLVGIGEEHRFYRYSSGNHNYGHVDLPYIKKPVQVPEQCVEYVDESILTVTFYLNDVHVGGKTNFFLHDKNIVSHSVTPKQGDVVIFSHNIWHEGGLIPANSNETKYILRTDAMYRFTRPL